MKALHLNIIIVILVIILLLYQSFLIKQNEWSIMRLRLSLQGQSCINDALVIDMTNNKQTSIAIKEYRVDLIRAMQLQTAGCDAKKPFDNYPSSLAKMRISYDNTNGDD